MKAPAWSNVRREIPDLRFLADMRRSPLSHSSEIGRLCFRPRRATSHFFRTEVTKREYGRHADGGLRLARSDLVDDRPLGSADHRRLFLGDRVGGGGGGRTRL